MKLPEPPNSGAHLAAILRQEDSVVLDRLIRRAKRIGRASEQTRLTRGPGPDTTRIPVAISVTALRESPAGSRGVVLVIEDLSELLAAQRAAAWSEVARRMAHEIKNPLTPIQLSAERIARCFGLQMNGSSNGGDSVPANGNLENGKDRKNVEPIGLGEAKREELARVVEECTTSITREVAGLKAMVDEFSRFARLPHPRMEPADLNEVVRQTALLYEDRLNGTDLKLDLAASLPATMIDTEQFKRVFVNLIDNSLEALENSAGERLVTITTEYDAARETLIATIVDTGEGIRKEDSRRLFQPNFSTRGRGTGLGLAIVDRIVVEHGGQIRAELNQTRGAKFVIELPFSGSDQ